MTMISISDKFNHLMKVLSSKRFLQKQILCNEVPFFIADYDIKQEDEILDMEKKLVKQLKAKGVTVLTINLYDLSIEILKENGDWDWYIKNENTMTKDELKEEFQSILDVENVITPAIAAKCETEYDILFLTGIGEVFPYIRSHNVLNNLQKVTKDKPTLMFFPGKYEQLQTTSSSLNLFGRLKDDKYYRAANIYEIKEV